MNVSYEEMGESLVGWSQLGNLKLVKTWSERARLDLDFQTENGSMTALIAAIVNGHYEVAEYLLQAGADPSLADADGVTALHYAILHVEDLEFDANKYIALLINAKANVNAQTNNGKTPLHLACQLNEIGICRKLILSDADVFIKDRRDMYPHSVEICGQEFHEQFLEKFRYIIGKRILDLKKQFNYVITASIESGVFTEHYIASDILNLEPPSPMIDSHHQDGEMQISPDERGTNFVNSPTSFDFMHCLSPYKASASSNNHYKLPPIPQQQQQNGQQRLQPNNHQHQPQQQKQQNNQSQQQQQYHQSNTKSLLGSTTLPENTISLNVMTPRKNAKRPFNSEQGPIHLDEDGDDDNVDDRLHFQNGDSTPSTQRKFPVVPAQTFSSSQSRQGLQCAREISPSPDTRKTMSHQSAIPNSSLGRSFAQQLLRESQDDSSEGEGHNDFLRPSPHKPFKQNKTRAELAPRTSEPNVQLIFGDEDRYEPSGESVSYEPPSREEQFMLQIRQKNLSNLQGSPKLTPRRPQKRSRLEQQQQQQPQQQQQQNQQQQVQQQQQPVLLTSSDEFRIPSKDHLSNSDPIIENQSEYSHSLQQQQLLLHRSNHNNNNNNNNRATPLNGANHVSNGHGNEYPHVPNVPSPTSKNLQNGHNNGHNGQNAQNGHNNGSSPTNRPLNFNLHNDFNNGHHIDYYNNNGTRSAPVTPLKSSPSSATEESPRKKKVVLATVSPYK
jgi:hypothetical protein